MTVGRALLAVFLFSAAASAGEHDRHAGHDKAAPGLRAQSPTAPISRGDASEPRGTCRSARAEGCYAPEQLSELADQLQAQFPSIKQVGAIVRGAKPGTDVSPSDIDQLRGYFGAEQKFYEALKARVTPEQWAAIESGSPEQARAVFKSLPREVRSELRPLAHAVGDSMKNGLMAPGDMNPYHDTLAKNDPIAERIMKHMDGGPPMTGGQWQSAEPNNPNAHTYGGQQSLESGDPRSAEMQARQAIALDPQNAEAYSILSAALYDLQQKREAYAAAQRALELNPNDGRAAAVSRLAHDTIGAGTKLPGVAKPDDHAEAALAGGAVWRASAAGLDVAQALVANASARRAEKLLSVGDADGALAQASAAVDADPRYAHAYGLKAFAHLKAGRADEALKDAMSGLAADPKDKLSMKARAQALIRMGQYKEGLLAAIAAGEADPGSGMARYLEAAARSGMGDSVGALEALRRAAALDPKYAEVYKTGLQLAQNGDMSLLFGDDHGPAASAKPGAPAPASRRRWRFGAILAAALAGGGFLAFGFLRLFGPRLREALTTALRRSEPVAAPAADAPMPSTSAGRSPFEILRQIGAGGMGLVFEGRDVSLDRRVAVKKMRDELRLDRRNRDRFVTEAKLVAALRHPNVVEIYSIIDEGNELSLIFEFVDGRTLHDVISERRRLPFGEALRVFQGVAQALEAAHGRGIIHRDLKPSNIMLASDGTPKVMDFGIARAAKDALTRFSMTNTVVGTPPYMAPEQEQGVVRKESDVYALAICLYEMVTGQLPFVGGSAGGMLMAKINKAYTPATRQAPDLPEGFDAVMDRALDPDPDKRFRSIAELRRALEALPVSV